MAFFSKDLSCAQLYKNTVFGVYTVIEELYWLYADTFFKRNIKKLEKQKERFEKERNILALTNADEKLDKLKEEHEKFRKIMIEKRALYLD